MKKLKTLLGIIRKEDIVTSFKYLILLFMAIFLTTLVLSGCGSKGTTTKFRFTPIGSMEDGTTDPQKLTEDLDVLLRSEDTKRMERLQEEAKPKTEKEKNPSGQKVDETS